MGRRTAFSVGGERFVVLSAPVVRPAEGCPLTPAERDVAALIVAGRSNAEIARARRVSVRTIANQVAAILRKMNVASRFELAERL